MSRAPHIEEGLAHHRRGDVAAARAVYETILATEPAHFDALHLLGLIALQAGRAQEAVTLIGRAIAASPTHPGRADAYVNFGSAYKALGAFDDALRCYEQAIALNPRHADAYYNRGNVLRDRNDLAGARAAFAVAHDLRPADPAFAYNLGLVCEALGENEAALAAFAAARRNGLDLPDLHERLGAAMSKAGRPEEAIAHFAAVIAARPNDAVAYNNRAVALAELERFPEAIADYDRAIALNPDTFASYLNRALAHHRAGDLEAAVADFARAEALNPQSIRAAAKHANTLAEIGRPIEADAAFARAAALAPDHTFLMGTWLYMRMLMCDWRDYAEDVAKLKAMVERGLPSAPPLGFAAISDDLRLQRMAAAAWAAEHGVAEARAAAPVVPAAEKIRVGYFSADFRMHPVSQLAVGLFEHHDRKRFQTFAFSTGPDSKDAMRARLESAFDRFIDVRTRSDAGVVEMARDLHLDIAVDLTGYTGGSRPGIFARRAAPVQVSYLGFPATLGVPYIDYIVADATLIPTAARPFYAEKVITLPSFQVNDRSRVIEKGTFTRAQLGLPAEGFVFACLNNPYKITPDVFSTWMRILARVPASCLFLAADELPARNLKRAAAARGIDPARIVIGKKVPTAEYWARLRAADIFLDTAPFNAHSTAADALWAGLPIVTCPGESYAARVAASLLTAVGLPELIAPTWTAYEDLAVALAEAPKRLAEIRGRLADNRLSTRLFDTVAFTRTLETAYTEIIGRHRAGLAPEHIFIGGQ